MFKVVCVGAFHRKGIKLLESRPDLVTYEVLTDLSPENVARGVAGADAVVVRGRTHAHDAAGAGQGCDGG